MKMIKLGTTQHINAIQIQSVSFRIERDESKDLCAVIRVWCKNTKTPYSVIFQIKEAEYIITEERFGPFKMFKANTKTLVKYKLEDYQDDEDYIDALNMYNEILKTLEEV